MVGFVIDLAAGRREENLILYIELIKAGRSGL
jgi:hypothetical protein